MNIVGAVAFWFLITLCMDDQNNMVKWIRLCVISQDIPSLTAEAAKEHPGVSYIVSAPLGLHPLLVVWPWNLLNLIIFRHSRRSLNFLKLCPKLCWMLILMVECIYPGFRNMSTKLREIVLAIFDMHFNHISPCFRSNMRSVVVGCFEW